MCGRYYIEGEHGDDEMIRILSEIQHRQGNSQAHAAMKQGEIFPTNIVPALLADGPVLMRWGYAGYKNKVINARSETAFEKPMFRRSMLERRCLLPASGYYEWQRTASGGKTKQKYALFSVAQPTLFLAGLWREEKGESLPVFVILTREAGAGISQIHDRMPVILPPAARQDWLGANANPAQAMSMAVTEMTYQPARP